MWDSWRGYGLQAQYWSNETDGNGKTYQRFNIKRTNNYSNVISLWFGTGDHLMEWYDQKHMVVFHGGGDIIKYDDNGYRDEMFERTAPNQNNKMYLDFVGRIYTKQDGTTKYWRIHNANTAWGTSNFNF